MKVVLVLLSIAGWIWLPLAAGLFWLRWRTIKQVGPASPDTDLPSGTAGPT